MTKPILYTSYISPGGRAVQFTGHYLNLEFDVKEILITSGEQLTPEYLKLNPQRTVPVLIDNDLVICDSHAICTYLINKYDPNNGLYPQDSVQRARIDQRLYFDASISFPLLKRSFLKIRRGQVYPLPAEDVAEFRQAYDLLETFLQNTDHIAGDKLSIADFFTFGTFCALNEMVAIDVDKYRRIHGWMRRMTELPVYEKIHKPKFDKFVELYTNTLAELQAETKK